MQVAVRFIDAQISGCCRVRVGEAQGQVDAGPGAVLPDHLPVQIVAQNRQQGHGKAEPGQVLGDVPPDAARGQADPPGIGIPGPESAEGRAGEVHVHGSGDDDARNAPRRPDIRKILHFFYLREIRFKKATGTEPGCLCAHYFFSMDFSQQS